MASSTTAAGGALPPGVLPLNMSAKYMDRHALKTGAGLRDTVPFKLFPKQMILDEIQALGFYSAFNDIKAQIQAYPGAEILVVADPTERFGENWYVCTTEEARIREMEAMTAAEREAEAAAARAAEEEARKAAEAHALETLIVHEEPMIARPYTSASAESSYEDVRGMTVRRSRPLLAVRIQRRRYAFGARVAFNDRESDAGLAEFRPRKEPAYELRRKEMHVGLQMCPSTLSGRVDAAAQTQWNAPQNASVHVDMDSADAVEELANSHPLAVALNGMSAVTSFPSGIGASLQQQHAADSPARMDPAALRALLHEAVAIAAGYEAGAPLPDVGMPRAGRSSSLSGDMLLAPASMLARHSSSGGNMGVASGSATASFPIGGFVAGAPSGKGTNSSAMERLVDFMYRALPMCEQALSQNETLNIFRNELTLLAEDEVMVMGNTEAKHIREERQFMDLELSNNKALVAVEWHPSSPAWLAVAAMPRHSMETRVAESVLPRTSHVLLYTLTEFSNQLVLEAPADITCMHWNPRNANLIAVGCISGQVALFDMSEAHEAMAARRKAAAAAADGARVSDDTNTSTKALHVKPKYVSAVESSHGRSVTGLRWLPSEHHLSTRNQFMPERDGDVYQFVTAGSDGMVAVWDIRFRERTRTRRRASVTDGSGPSVSNTGVRGGAAVDPSLLQSALVPGAAAAGVPAPPTDIPWAPQYRTVVRFGAGPVNITSFILHEKQPSDPVIAGSEEGKIMVIDWAPAGEGTGSDEWLNSGSSSSAASTKEASPAADAPARAAAPVAAASSDDAGGDAGATSGAAMRVLWMSQDADRPPVAMQRSPFWQDVFLTVSDFAFSIWRRGVKSPVFTSSASPVPNTAGRWSPSRPAVIFIGRSDGVLDVWDLLDSTIKPTVSFPIMSLPVTSMEFRSSSAAASTNSTTAGGMWATGLLVGSTVGQAAGASTKQLLAVGDAKGSLHVLDIPLPLRKGVHNEEALASAYLDREAARVGYVASRIAFHDAEMARLDADAARDQAAREASAAKAEAELQAARTALAEKDPVAARLLDAATLERNRSEAARKAAEERYAALEKSIMAELGVAHTDADGVAVLQRRVDAENAEGMDGTRRGSSGPDAPLLKAAPRLSTAGRGPAASSTSTRRISAAQRPAEEHKLGK